MTLGHFAKFSVRSGGRGWTTHFLISDHSAGKRIRVVRPLSFILSTLRRSFCRIRLTLNFG